MSDSAWYVVKQANGQCVILSIEQLEPGQMEGLATPPEQWGPYTSEHDAIARRIGLIRAGKCQPA